MEKIFPKKLQKGSHLRVIAPSRSLSLIGEETMEIANTRLAEMGFQLSFGKHVYEMDDFHSSSIEHRLEDLHDAFEDKSVDGILTVIGGFNCNQLLRSIDWECIKKNPKVLFGYSDITVLNNSIYQKTGLITYSGPHYSTFGQKMHFEYTQQYFEKMVLSNNEVQVESSNEWSDDQWWLYQDDRNPIKNPGHVVFNQGEAQGTVLGGNLCTLNLLQGTEFMPDLHDSVVFFEDDELTFPAEFDRNLQSLLHLPSFKGVRGLVIGRFQKASKMSLPLLEQIIKSKEVLRNIPVIAEVDFGHTDPKITLPIGGEVRISAKNESTSIVFTKH